MKRLKILIDIDGIVADSLPYWLAFLQQKFKTSWRAKVEDIKLWDMSKCPPLDQFKSEDILGVLQDQYFTIGVPLMFGAAPALQELMAQGHEIYLVTARSGGQHVADTFEWVAKTLPFINIREQLIFCSNKTLIPADVLIDDRAETLVKYQAKYPQATTMAISYPYNIDLPPVHKIFGGRNYANRGLVWGQILGYITALAETAGPEYLKDLKTTNT